MGSVGQGAYSAAKAGHRRAHDGGVGRARPVRRDRQRDRAGGPHPHDRGGLRRHDGGARTTTRSTRWRRRTSRRSWSGSARPTRPASPAGSSRSRAGSSPWPTAGSTARARTRARAGSRPRSARSCGGLLAEAPGPGAGLRGVGRRRWRLEHGVAAQARIRPDKVAFVHHDRPHHLRRARRARAPAPRTCCAAHGVGPGRPPRHRARATGPSGSSPRSARPASARSACRSRAARPPTSASTSAPTATSRSSSTRTGWPSSSPRSTPRRPSRIADAAPDYVQLRAYTSGTTGRPKAVLRPEVDVVAQHRGPRALLHRRTGSTRPTRSTSPGRRCTTSPGSAVRTARCSLGHTTVLLDHFDAAEWFDAVTEYGGTYSWIARRCTCTG